MTDPGPADITRLLKSIEQGETGAAERLAPLVYGELHRMAVRALQGEQPGHTLQPTALVHDAFLRLTGGAPVDWQDRAHFYRVAARLMRRVLVDHARQRRAAKRDGGLRVTFDESLASEDPSDRVLDLIALEDAMKRLESLDERPAQVVELRFFAGFDVEETARALRISPASVKRDWVFAQAFLRRELAAGGAGA